MVKFRYVILDDYDNVIEVLHESQEYNDSEDGNFDYGVKLGAVTTILLFIEIILIGCITNNPCPTAMDVYRGKTTLEYKVVDNVKVDSIVIFKDDDYGSN